MRKSGALTEQNVPHVIWDNMTLCEDLGERFLWTDRLCMFQDNPQDFRQQISAINQIFRGALPTIVAATNGKCT